MNTATLQIPISRQLKLKATEIAEDQGFSSLQEIVRVFLNQLATKKIAVSFTQQVLLSEKNDIRYGKMISEIKTGRAKLKSFTDTQTLMAYLKS